MLYFVIKSSIILKIDRIFPFLCSSCELCIIIIITCWVRVYRLSAKKLTHAVIPGHALSGPFGGRPMFLSALCLVAFALGLQKGHSSALKHFWSRPRTGTGSESRITSRERDAHCVFMPRKGCESVNEWRVSVSLWSVYLNINISTLLWFDTKNTLG